jgi:hypothetical protein
VSDDGPGGPPHQPRRDTQQRGSARSGDAGTRLYQGSVRIFSAVLLCLGLGLVALTIAKGGGPLSVGVLMGVAFLAVGAARLWLAFRMSR